MPKRTIEDVDSYFSIDKVSTKDKSKKKVEEISVNDVKGAKEYNDLEMRVFGGEDGFEEGLDEFIHSHQREVKVKDLLNEKKPKWKDDDDDLLKKQAIEAQKPTWATQENQKDEEEEEDDDDDDDDSEDGGGLEWETGDYISKTQRLPPHTLQHSYCDNINLAHVADAKVRVLEMMKRDQIAMVGGTTLKLFKVGGKKSPNHEIKPHTIALEKFPVAMAKFVANETQILIGSRYPSFVTYDMAASKVVKHSIKDMQLASNTNLFEVSPDDKLVAMVAKQGAINLISAQSKGWIHTLKGQAEAAEKLCFTHDSSKLYVHADSGVVYIWCLRTNKCIGRFQDQGCHRGTAIKTSPCGGFLATGCSSGIVNVYEARKLENSIHTTKRFELATPAPLKSVENLVSACTSLTFHPSSHILAMASNYNQDSLKLLHLNSLSVFSNFPEVTNARKFGVVYSLAFSPLGGGYMGVGNHKGIAALVRLKHFSSY